MPATLKSIFLLSLAISFVFCTTTTTDSDDDEDDLEPEFRGFSHAEYETWKPAAQPSAPEVILIKQKDPHHSDHSDIMSTFHSTIKHHLPLLAVLAPLVAVSVLLPLKAYLGPSYVIYPPVAAPAPPAATKNEDRVGKAENEGLSHSLAIQVLNMIEEMDRMYEEMATKKKES